MPNESTVSTAETPRPRETINVVTEENQAEPALLTPDAAPPTHGAPKTEAPAPSTSETPPAAPRTRRRSSERKIAALQRQLGEAQAAGEARDTEVAHLRAQVEAMQKGSAPQAKKPRLQDFMNAEEYADAHSDWKAAAAPKPPAPPPAAPASQAPPQQSAPPPRPPEVQDLTARGVEIYGDDFTEVLDDKTLPLSAAMADHIFDSDRGPDLVMWLDENREDATELFHLRPKRLAERLAEIEKTLDPPPTPAAPAKARAPDGKFESRQPAAHVPPPGDPVGSSPGADGVSGGVREGLSMDDYAERRRAQMARNRTR